MQCKKKKEEEEEDKKKKKMKKTDGVSQKMMTKKDMECHLQVN